MALRRTTQPGFRDPRYKALIERLVQRRHELDLTQQAVAERLQLHKQFVSRVELGERRLDVVELVDFAAVLGLVASDLLADIPTIEWSKANGGHDPLQT